MALTEAGGGAVMKPPNQRAPARRHGVAIYALAVPDPSDSGQSDGETGSAWDDTARRTYSSATRRARYLPR